MATTMTVTIETPKHNNKYRTYTAWSIHNKVKCNSSPMSCHCICGLCTERNKAWNKR